MNTTFELDSLALSHELDSSFKFSAHKPLSVLVIGCGGTGSAVVAGLPQLHNALVAWGHGAGLQVTVMDGDTISPTNCVRQPFGAADIGKNKATVLVNRLNMFHNFQWDSCESFFSEDLKASQTIDLVISCVDTLAARAEMDAAFNKRGGNWSRVRYWLDIGNDKNFGQYVLGQPVNDVNKRCATRLRTAPEMLPQLMDVSRGEGDLPSCSAAEALDKQEPYLNSSLSHLSLAMITQLLHHGKIDYHGAFYNAVSGNTSSMLIDPKNWKRKDREYRLRREELALAA